MIKSLLLMINNYIICISGNTMGDRQRNFMQYATALNQFSSFNNDGGVNEAVAIVEMEAVGSALAVTAGSGGSSGASHGGTTAAGNAALWGELSRSLQYNNYPGFGSAWQGGSGDMRLYGYGGYGEGQVDGRAEPRSESRGEGRRVPSKGETKATPPLPPGMTAGVGSALASLQQLVAGGGDAATVYRNLLAARQSTVDHRDSPHDSPSNSPADPAVRLPPSREAFPSQGMSQAMSHALAHPFLAAHLNANQLLQMTQTPTTEMDYQVVDGQLEECGDTKRRTRQKRAISYVEDGTDPVLEMNEDSSPDATPLKKKGRRSKDAKDRLDGESNPSPEQQVPSVDEESFVEFLEVALMASSTQEFSSVTEPLHVDTTLIHEPDLRVPGPPPITPSSCSPDVYDFNDTDSDGVGRGRKRGRKKGSSPKKNAKSPLEMAKSSISPRPREPHAKSPRSPKFFSSSRSPITERNKEWLRGISPPIRDLSKTPADIPVPDGTATPNLLQESVVDISKTISLSEEVLIQDSPTGDTPVADNATKPDTDVVSPRRSSRRNKTRDQEIVSVKGNESMDSSLPSSPSGNSKNNTCFSGLISGNAQNKEDKEEKFFDMAAVETQPVDGVGDSPSSRMRKRNRRSTEQAPDQQTDNNETQTVPTQENDEPKTAVEPVKLPEEAPSKCETELATTLDKNAEKSETASEDGVKSCKGTEMKDSPSKNGKGALKKNDVSKVTSVLPHETKQYQHVPEDAFDNSKTPSGTTTTEGEHSYIKDKAPVQESGTSIPISLVSDAKKSDTTPRKSRPKRGADFQLVQNNFLSIDGTFNGPDLASCHNSSEETTTVITQAMEEMESRGRRLRTRRASAKQDAKSETQDAKSEAQDAKSETVDVNTEAKDTKSEASDAKSDALGAETETQVAKSEVNDTVLEMGEIKIETQNTKIETQDVQSKTQDVISETQEAKSQTSSTNLNTQEPSDKPEMSCPENNSDVGPSAVEPSKKSTVTLDTPEVSSMPVIHPEVLEVPQGTDVDVDAETVENIAKFLEETASSIPASTEESYVDKRPKRSSRPPRKMDENEMNDLLILLNMEDEESEDEDYVPKDLENFDSMAESDDGGDSEGNDDGEFDDFDSSDDCERESRGSGTLSNLLTMASDIGDNDFVPTALKHGKGGPTKQKGLKKDKGKKMKADASSAKKGKVIKGKIKNNKFRNDDVEVRKENEEGRKKSEVYEKRGPFIRLDESRCREVIVNAPHRDEDELEKPMRKTNIQFYCKIEAKQKTA
ncbi:Polysialic acid O-acetyltransferase-like 3, partial [Homarus americanus]